MGQVSIMGFFENLAFISPILMLILLPIGFIGSAWITNTVFDYLNRNIDDVKTVDQVGTLFLLVGLFGTYAYGIFALFSEKS